MHPSLFELNAECERRHWWFVARRRIVRDLLVRLVPPSSGSLIIDVGCGTGANVESLADEYRCIGIDVSNDAITLARSKGRRSVEYICGSAPEALGSRAIDARGFLLMDVLEHVEDDAGLFRRILEAAAAGAIFIVTVPADPALWSVHDRQHGHFRRYDVPSLRSVFRGLPVEILLVRYFHTRLFPLVRLVRIASRWRGVGYGRCSTDIRMERPWINSILTEIFAGERFALAAALSCRPGMAKSARGSSLLAILRKSAPAAPDSRDETATATR